MPEFIIDFVVNILNFNATKAKFDFYALHSNNSLQERNFEISPVLITPDGRKYLWVLVPADSLTEKAVAIVPIFRTPKVDVPFKIFYLVIALVGLFLIFLFSVKLFQTREKKTENFWYDLDFTN